MDSFFKFGVNYIEEVIRPLLPNARMESFIQNDYNLFGPNQLSDSIYDRPLNEDSYFFHFTSLTSFLEIVRSKIIRMSDFNSFRDKFELSFANNNLVDNPSYFQELKSCLFALSMCEESGENLHNEYMWEKYGDNHKGVCIRLKINKNNSVFSNFHLGKIIYKETNEISELRALKTRHLNFQKENGKAISNLGNILLSACSMYKKENPYKNENEIRLLAYIFKNRNHIHYNNTYPIRHKYNSQQDLIECFLELELEYENGNGKCYLPSISIDSIILGNNLYGDSIGKLYRVLEYEFKDSFNRELKIYRSD